MNTPKFPTTVINKLPKKEEPEQKTHSPMFPKDKVPLQTQNKRDKEKHSLYIPPFVIFMQVNFFREIILLYTLLQKSSTHQIFRQYASLNFNILPVTKTIAII